MIASSHFRAGYFVLDWFFQKQQVLPTLRFGVAEGPHPVDFSLCSPRLSFGAQDWLGQWNIPLPGCSPTRGTVDARTNRICVILHEVGPLIINHLSALRSQLVYDLGEATHREDWPGQDSKLGWTQMTPE